MRQNNNWFGLADYSHQNHTLKFARQSRNRDTYHCAEDDHNILGTVISATVGFFAFIVFILIVQV